MIAGVPYDAEVEYLESTGTQWIDTGVVMTASLFENAETTIVVQETEIIALTRNFFGDGTSGYDGYTFGCVSGYRMQACNGVYATQGNSATPFSTTNPNIVKVSSSGIFLNGNRQPSIQASSATFSGTLLLFGCRRNGEFFTVTQFSGRIYSAKMVSNGLTIFDFIPVRVGSGANAVGYMYDRVSKRLFGNAGIGAFTIGPDVAKPVMGVNKYGASRYGIIGARSILYRGA